MISIIIPTYNGADFLKKYSLPSLLKQTFSDWEALIVNDCSTDKSSDVVNDFIKKDKRFKLIEQKENMGLAAALNLGLNKSNGDIIAILEHDDVWLPKKLELQKIIIEQGGKIISCRAIIYHTKLKDFVKINDGNFSCLMFKKEIAEKIFPLPEENKKYLGIEDGIVTARIEIAKANGFIRDNDFKIIPEIMTIMNSNESTLSGTKDSVKMKDKYYKIGLLFSELKGKYPKIDILLNFWKKHYYYNLLLTILPKSIKKIIYKIVDGLKRRKDLKKVIFFHKTQTKEYENIKSYRKLFD